MNIIDGKSLLIQGIDCTITSMCRQLICVDDFLYKSGAMTHWGPVRIHESSYAVQNIYKMQHLTFYDSSKNKISCISQINTSGPQGVPHHIWNLGSQSPAQQATSYNHYQLHPIS